MNEPLNSLRLDVETREIRIAQGATGYFRVDLLTDGTLDVDADKAVFAVARDERVGRVHNYTNVFRRDYAISADADGYYVIVDLANEDTRGMEPGNYVWSVIVVTDPETDGDGDVIVDERADGVYPLWSGAEQPTFVLEGVAHVV